MCFNDSVRSKMSLSWTGAVTRLSLSGSTWQLFRLAILCERLRAASVVEV